MNKRQNKKQIKKNIMKQYENTPIIVKKVIWSKKEQKFIILAKTKTKLKVGQVI